MRIIMLLSLILLAGCAVKKPIQWAYKPILGTYCIERNTSGTGPLCLRWAPHVKYACVNDPQTGDCTRGSK